MAPEPAKEAVDAVAYFNEAWTPYHAVLATCRRLIDAGYEVRARPVTVIPRIKICCWFLVSRRPPCPSN